MKTMLALLLFATCAHASDLEKTLEQIDRNLYGRESRYVQESDTRIQRHINDMRVREYQTERGFVEIRTIQQLEDLSNAVRDIKKELEKK